MFIQSPKHKQMQHLENPSFESPQPYREVSAAEQYRVVDPAKLYRVVGSAALSGGEIAYTPDYSLGEDAYTFQPSRTEPSPAAVSAGIDQAEAYANNQQVESDIRTAVRDKIKAQTQPTTASRPAAKPAPKRAQPDASAFSRSGRYTTAAATEGPVKVHATVGEPIREGQVAEADIVDAVLVEEPIRESKAAKADIVDAVLVDEPEAKASSLRKQALELEAAKPDTTPEQPVDNRVHDIEAAHAAAIEENKEFGANQTRVHDIAEAYEAAQKEDTKREVARQEKLALEQQQKAQKDEQKVKAAANPANKTPQEQIVEALKPTTQDKLRQEAAAVLTHANLPTAILGSATVTKDNDGNLTIISDNRATFISHQADGTPTLTQFAYDNASKTFSVNKDQFYVVTDPAQYEGTDVQNWQTLEEVIPLPADIAKKFGIEQAKIAKK
jgi:hypothetical protein